MKRIFHACFMLTLLFLFITGCGKTITTKIYTDLVLEEGNK